MEGQTERGQRGTIGVKAQKVSLAKAPGKKLTTVAICKFLPALRPTCRAMPFDYRTPSRTERDKRCQREDDGCRGREGQTTVVDRAAPRELQTLLTNHKVAGQRVGSLHHNERS